jgi:hypothetical protein
MWTEHYLRAESEEAFLAALPEEWKDEDGSPVGAAEAALDVVGPVGEWYLANLRMRSVLPEGLGGLVIDPPQHPKRVFAAG